MLGTTGTTDHADRDLIPSLTPAQCSDSHYPYTTPPPKNKKQLNGERVDSNMNALLND
jgi:hypothetical protein